MTRLYSIGMPVMVSLALMIRLVPAEVDEGIADMSKRASFASKIRKMDQVDDLLVKLESQNPASESYWERLAFAQHLLGDPTRAINSYQNGLQRHPQNLPLRLLCLRWQLLIEADVNGIIGDHLRHIVEEDLEEFGLSLLAFLEVTQLDYLQRMEGLSALFDHVESKEIISLQKMDWLVEAFRILILDYDARPNQSNRKTSIFTPSAKSEARGRLHDRGLAITEEIADREQASGEEALQRHQTYLLFLQILTHLNVQQDISSRFEKLLREAPRTVSSIGSFISIV